jgi:hypothetical protein
MLRIISIITNLNKFNFSLDLETCKYIYLYIFNKFATEVTIVWPKAKVKSVRLKLIIFKHLEQILQ